MKKVFLLILIFTVSLIFAEEKKISFSADKMSGTSGKKNGTTGLEGNAKVNIDSLEITGDKIDLYGKDFRYVSASGNVKGIDSEKGFNFTAQNLTYDRDLELASFNGNAKLLDTKNEVESSAGMITYNQKTEIAFLQINVKLKRKDISCTSSFATYRRTLSLLDLTGSPLVIRDGDEFRADRISVNLETEYISLDGSVSGSLKEIKKKEPKANFGDENTGITEKSDSEVGIDDPEETVDEEELTDEQALETSDIPEKTAVPGELSLKEEPSMEIIKASSPTVTSKSVKDKDQ